MACLCWAIDNNLTRKVAASDAVQIAGIKGLVAGVVNLSIAFAFNMSMPQMDTAFTAGIVGFCGYGLSLVLFVLGLRHLGTARTGAYFSVAPFVGAFPPDFAGGTKYGSIVRQRADGIRRLAASDGDTRTRAHA